MRLTTRALLAVGAVLATALVAVPAHADPLTATTTTVTGPASSVSGSSVTFTATVAEATPADPVVVPTGTVSFSTGAGEPVAVALVDGVATYAVSGLAVGSWTITATYVPDAGHEASSGTLAHSVTAPPTPPAPPVSTTPPPAPNPPAPAKPVKKPTVQLSVSKSAVSVGDKVTLRWSSKNAEAAVASGAWKGTHKAKGTATLRITDRGTYRFKITVKNAAGKDSAKVTVVATRKAKELALVVTDELVLPGAKLPVRGDGLAAGEKFTLRLDGKAVVSGTADKKGDVVKTIVLPAKLADGEHTLTLTGSNPSRVGEAVLTAMGPRELDVEVGADQLGPGETQTVVVEGLLAGEKVVLTLNGKPLAEGTADDSGTFTHEFEVGQKKGLRTVEAVGAIPGRSGEARFSVKPVRGPEL